MVDNVERSSDVLAQRDIFCAEPSQIATVGREDDVDDVDDGDIGTEMNKQVLLEDLSPTKTRLNYD